MSILNKLIIHHRHYTHVHTDSEEPVIVEVDTPEDPSLLPDFRTSAEKNSFIKVIHYHPDKRRFELSSLESLIELELYLRQMNSSAINLLWIDICTSDTPAVLKELSDKFPLHPMTTDNITDETLGTKLEDFEEYGFLNLQSFYRVPDRTTQQNLFQNIKISFVVGSWFILTFQSPGHDSFATMRNRLLHTTRVLPKIRSDFLLHFLLDGLIDQYFDLLEIVGSEVDTLSHQLFKAYQADLIENLYNLNQYLFLLRKEIMPLSEIILLLKSGFITFDDTETSTYFGNIRDHLLKLTENLNFHRDSLNNLMNLYYSLSDQKLNQIMKTLTVVSTVFIPLTFIVGLYGMNFEYMPELKWKYGYGIVWATMVVVSLWIILYMKRKKWL
ncbi:magnesium/cobalt transporter CorA [Entomospira entomophila]|uniref:Magnesium transport protein CorA n=1 Tax=Entomospira entomophila TaxID=2719988 RepID=A0A968GAI7_9SPIO|nr:magnesium/cobalt transporter CorA [Entomospira entomophilus]NIZ40942.1 magnesium/cobalt transporter CorA [Entomospira entomophilus]WDI35155.1 magnesium/cobalt transporter CorA [Entomospira entomophilus]